MPEVPLKPVRKPPLPGLTGVRTFLALGIMLFHFTPPHIEWIKPVIESGFTYISFFLLISGFILSYNYSERAATLKVREFYLARMARLYPVYLLSLIVSLQMYSQEWHYQTHVHFWEGTILTPLLLQGWNPMLATFWNTVAWTLSTEVMLYLAFPFLNRANWWPKSPSRLIALFFGFWLLELTVPTAYLLINPDGLAHMDRYSYGFWIRAVKYTPIPYVPIFLAGITLGRLHSIVHVSDRVRMWMAVSAAGTVLTIFYTVIEKLPYVMLHGGLLTPIFATLIFGLTGSHWMTRFLSLRPIAILGEASFCLYLLHFNTWILLHLFHVPDRLHLATLDPWLSYVIIIGVAYIAFRFVETPSRRYLLARWVHRKPHPMEPANIGG
ncbi:acyltransferase family protein [Terriglobus saanensis]|uniref:Acyltransferase 3 n=1 Tax=Terriglobus saanensis (strain ATCC BAA-1853 / DSM 23119 / SP1PR4) TaxID=401053 RepID=E8V5Y5_TERSS|nr:acyltransferase [Terriglobus saanensis]ADV83803.1 acyltransferase 3 [Terriglobus saanensis SP1PR4]